ncbi:Lreu_0056 family protein [Limosilactobacillus reuteri]
MKYTSQRNAKLKTKDLTLAQLRKEFYQTRSQKKQVDNYVAGLRTE